MFVEFVVCYVDGVCGEIVFVVEGVLLVFVLFDDGVVWVLLLVVDGICFKEVFVEVVELIGFGCCEFYEVVLCVC